MTKRGAVLAIAVATSLWAHGCAARPEDCARSDVHCAGLLTEFGPVEEGIAQQAWLALLDARSSGLLDRVDYIETIDTRDRAANISALSEEGYDIIVTVGSGIAEATMTAAQQYLDVHFIGVQQARAPEPKPANLVALVFPEDESGFLAGAAAAMTTRTGHVAAVCESDYIDWIRSYCEGFLAGARYVDDTVEIDVFHRSGPQELLFHDVDWGRATALMAVDQGADVLFAVGSETADAALLAAASRGALVIGAETDQYERLAEIRPRLLTSAVLDVRSGVLNLLQEANEGRFPAGKFAGGTGLAPFHELEGWLEPGAIARLQRIARDLQEDVIDYNVP